MEREAPQGRLFNQWLLADGSLWASFFRTEAGYWVRFPHLADFLVSSDGKSITTLPANGIPEQTIAHLYHNQVVPLALSRQFKLVFHSGAIEMGDTAIALLGVSGRGKSTLTASFALHGHRFLTDDGLQLECNGGDYCARPGHPSIRLRDDSKEELVTDATQCDSVIDYRSKSRLLASDAVVFCEEPRPLRAMYVLGEGKSDSVSIEPVAGSDAIIELVRHSFLLDIEEREMLRSHFHQLSDLLKSRGLYRLDYPRRFEYLPTVRAAIGEHVLALGHPAQ